MKGIAVRNGIRAAALLLAAAAMPPPGAARAENVWTYYAGGAPGNPTDAACVVRGEWTIQVNAAGTNPGQGKLWLGRVVSAPADGVLDLRDVLLAGTDRGAALDNVPVTSLRLPPDNGAGWDSANVVELRANHLPDSVGEPFGRAGAANSRLVHVASETATSIGGRFCNLTNLVIDFPNATTWRSPSFYNCSLTNDIAEIAPPWLQTIGNNLGGLGAGVTGTLVLTNLHDCGNQGIFPAGVTAGRLVFRGTEFGSQPFRNATGLRELELVAPDCTAFKLGYNSCNVTSIVLDVPLVASTDPRTTQLPLSRTEKSSVWFKNPPLAIDVVRAMLSGVPAVPSTGNQDKYCTIYCSGRQGWAELASPVDGPREKALAPAKCMGVLVDAAGNRRAWMVHREPTFDPEEGSSASADEEAVLFRAKDVFAASSFPAVRTDAEIVAADQNGPRLAVYAPTAEGGLEERWHWSPAEDPSLPPPAREWFGNLSECKPVEEGRTILVAASRGGVAAIDAGTRRAKWCTRVRVVNSGPHSAALLPDGCVAVANAQDANEIVLVDPRGAPFDAAAQKRRSVPFAGAHGAAWHEARGTLFAIGETNLCEFAYDGAALALAELRRWDFSAFCGDTHGHDLVPDGAGGFVFTTAGGVWRFDPETGAFAAECAVPDAKSWSHDPAAGDLLLVPTVRWWSDGLLLRTDGRTRTLGPVPGAKFYKARWLRPASPLPK